MNDTVSDLCKKAILFAAIIGAAIWIMFLTGGCAWLQKNVPDIPDADDLPGPVVTNAPAPIPDQAADVTITVTRVTASMIYWTGPNLDWPERGDLCGEAWLNGRKFDHIRRTTKSRDWKNVHGGYQGHVEPADGEACTIQLVSYDGKQRSNKAAFRWVR